jgi:Alpha/beta hydrolase family
MTMRKTKRLSWLLLLLIPFAIIIGFVAWAETPLGAMPPAEAALQSDSSVKVGTNGWMAFYPTGEKPKTGLILYPGGRVDPIAYASLAKEIASKGYLVVIQPAPLNLAVLSPGMADEIIQAYPEIEQWAIGGHSLGGAMAATYAKNHPADIKGLLLMAAYPSAQIDLSTSGLAVSSLYGTRDGVATRDKIDNSRQRLPPETKWVAIEGGNLAQFGWYGEQPGDNTATISREAQQAITVQAALELLKNIGSP